MGQTHPDAHTRPPTRERRGTTERRCSRATATASQRQNRASIPKSTSDQFGTPARPDETLPNRPRTSARSAAKGDAVQTPRDRCRPHSTHRPLTSVGAIKRATKDRTYGQAHREHPSPWGGRMTGREQPNPPAGLRSEVAALTSRCRAGLGERTPSRPHVPRRDLRKGTRSGNPSIVRSEPAMAAASASTSRCSKRRRGSARPPSRRTADADHHAAATGSARRRVTGWPVRAARRWQRARS